MTELIIENNKVSKLLTTGASLTIFPAKAGFQ